MAGHLPMRLHHNAYVTRDMEATRHFYEDLIGMPLVATWCEADDLFGKHVCTVTAKRKRSSNSACRRPG